MFVKTWLRATKEVGMSNIDRIKEIVKILSEIHNIPSDTTGAEEHLMLECFSYIQNVIDELYDVLNNADIPKCDNRLVKKFIEHCTLSRCRDDYFLITPAEDCPFLAIPESHQGEFLTGLKYGTTSYNLELVLHSIHGNRIANKIRDSLKT